MNRLVFVILTALALLGCGEAPEVGVRFNVQVEGLRQSEVSSIEATVLGPRLANDTILTCLSLRSGEVDARGSDTETLGQTVANVNLGEPVVLEISGIEEGPDRVVFVEALGISGEVVGRGCIEGVSISGGEMTQIDLLVSST